MQLAQTVGIDPKEVNFVAYDGGGDLLPAVLGGKVAFAASGFGEFLDQVEAGEVRVLAISGAERVDGCRRADPEGVRHRPGVHQLARRRRAARSSPTPTSRPWSTPSTKMHDSQEWKEVLTKNGWTDAYLTGGRVRHLPDRADQAVEDVLTKLGLA